jgi:superfamily II DNA or RNA helicase
LAILAIQKCNLRDANRVIHIVVPTTTLKNAWVKPKTGLIAKFKLKNVQVFVVNTYVKLPRVCDLLIADELHRYSNKDAYLFSKVIGDTKYTWFLGLSATLEQHHIAFLNSRHIKSCGHVSMQECKENGWVSDYQVVNFGIDLDEVDRERYDKLHKAFNQHFAMFNHDFDIAMQCLLSRDARHQRAEDLNISEQRLMISAIQWNKNMRERKAFLYNTHSKLTTAKELAKLDKHIICFSESVDFAEELAAQIGDKAVSFHSKNGVKTNRLNLAKFTDKRTRVNCMCTAKSMDEGFDAPDADMGIICSRTSKQLQSTQRVGRLIRAQEGKKAFIVNLYIKNSQDEVWLKKASKGTLCLWMDDLDQLKQLINDSR